MLKQVFKQLDGWCVRENRQRKNIGSPSLRPFEIKVLGQTALIEQSVSLPLVTTRDVDAYANFEYTAMREFERLLAKHGKSFDRHSSEIWMPKETRYRIVFSGEYVTGKVARPEYVLISKAKKAPERNAALLKAYVERGPSPLFRKLAKTYKINVEALR